MSDLKLAGQPPNSRPETDESLLPSRIAREKISPRIPRELALELKEFCFRNREELDIQTVVSEGIRLFIDRWNEAHGAHGGRPAAQPPSRPTAIKDQEISDLKTDTEIDDRSTSSSEIGGRPDGQLEEQFLAEITNRLSPDVFDTWFAPLKFTFDPERSEVTIESPNEAVASWVRTTYGPLIQIAFAALQLERWTIAWNVAKATSQPLTGPTQQRLTAADMKDELLDFYAVVMENPVRPQDVLDFNKIADCSPSSVRAGIMRSRIKARTRPNSFNYCVKPIRQIERAGLGPQLVDSLRHEVFKQPLLTPFTRERKPE